MTKKPNTSAQKIAILERKLLEVSAQLVHVYSFAKIGIKSADRKHMIGSGILVNLAYLGGKEVCPPFVLKDGLSDEAIAALSLDIEYSYAKTIEIKP